MDVITMSSVVQQGLIMRDRIFTVSVLLPDKPGELCRVSGIIAGVNGNVIKLSITSSSPSTGMPPWNSALPWRPMVRNIKTRLWKRWKRKATSQSR